MDIIAKQPPANNKPKRKRKSKTKFTTSENKVTTSENKVMKLETDPVAVTTVKVPKPVMTSKLSPETNISEDHGTKYPILKNHELVNKFLKVPMTNNQKGRIRQAIRDSLQGTSNVLVPEIIHNKIQSILKGSSILTDSELRRIRILYNLLKTSLKGEVLVGPTVKAKSEKIKKKSDGDSPKTAPKKDKEKEKDGVKTEKREQLVKKVKGPKRYVVFLGNLPLDVDKDKIMNHFSEMNEHIVDIRLPKPTEGKSKKSAIAYLELSNEPSYEFALSKHHSMLGSKRINVLYTAPKKGKVTKANAKSKSAKLIALQKTGKLVGSIPLSRKRSQRRLKMKKAQAKLAQGV